jgi:hypothetical protein
MSEPQAAIVVLENAHHEVVSQPVFHGQQLAILRVQAAHATHQPPGPDATLAVHVHCHYLVVDQTVLGRIGAPVHTIIHGGAMAPGAHP